MCRQTELLRAEQFSVPMATTGNPQGSGPDNRSAPELLQFLADLRRVTIMRDETFPANASVKCARLSSAETFKGVNFSVGPLPGRFSEETQVSSGSCDRYVLWIDGVGAWQMCVGRRFLIGGPTLEGQAADICLMANLSRRHATLERNGEDWFIHPHQSTVLSGRTLSAAAAMKSGDSICLAEKVRLGFRIPSVLSGTAVIDFESHHRPVHTVNGIILMTDTVILGPRRDHHICCSDWPEMLVIYRHDGVLKCRSKASFQVNGMRIRDAAVLSDGAVVSGDDFRFRIERTA